MNRLTESVRYIGTRQAQGKQIADSLPELMGLLAFLRPQSGGEIDGIEDGLVFDLILLGLDVYDVFACVVGEVLPLVKKFQ
jgi:hypothetical protein